MQQMILIFKVKTSSNLIHVMDFEDKNDLNFKANLHIGKSSEFEKPTFSNKVTSTKQLIKS